MIPVNSGQFPKSIVRIHFNFITINQKFMHLVSIEFMCVMICIRQNHWQLINFDTLSCFRQLFNFFFLFYFASSDDRQNQLIPCNIQWVSACYFHWTYCCSSERIQYMRCRLTSRWCNRQYCVVQSEMRIQSWIVNSDCFWMFSVHLGQMIRMLRNNL